MDTNSDPSIRQPMPPLLATPTAHRAEHKSCKSCERLSAERDVLEARLNSTKEELGKAVKTQRESQEQWSAERDQFSTEAKELRENLKGREDAIAGLTSKHKDDLNEQIRGFVSLQEGVNKKMTAENNTLRDQIESLQKTWHTDKGMSERVSKEIIAEDTALKEQIKSLKKAEYANKEMLESVKAEMFVDKEMLKCVKAEMVTNKKMSERVFEEMTAENDALKEQIESLQQAWDVDKEKMTAENDTLRENFHSLRKDWDTDKEMFERVNKKMAAENDALKEKIESLQQAWDTDRKMFGRVNEEKTTKNNALRERIEFLEAAWIRNKGIFERANAETEDSHKQAAQFKQRFSELEAESANTYAEPSHVNYGLESKEINQPSFEPPCPPQQTFQREGIRWRLCQQDAYWDYVGNALVATNSVQGPAMHLILSNAKIYTEVPSRYISQEALNQQNYSYSKAKTKDLQGMHPEGSYKVECAMTYLEIRSLVDLTTKIKNRTLLTQPSPKETMSADWNDSSFPGKDHSSMPLTRGSGAVEQRGEISSRRSKSNRRYNENGKDGTKRFAPLSEIPRDAGQPTLLNDFPKVLSFRGPRNSDPVDAKMNSDTDDRSDYVLKKHEPTHPPTEDAGFIPTRTEEKSRDESTLPPIENMKGTSGDEDCTLVETPTECSSDNSSWSPWEDDFEEDLDSLSFSPALEGLRSQCARNLFVRFQQCRNSLVGEPQNVGKSPTLGSSSTSKLMGSSCSTSQATGQRPSKRVKDDEPHEDDEKDENHKRSRKSRRLDVTDDRLLACPYCKHDPLRYRSCYGKVLKEISRLKQHLTRCHRVPIHCPLCSSEFDSEESRDDHIRRLSCERSGPKIWEGINETQKKQLEKRVSHKKSKEENWYEIYSILFPNASRPESPYLDMHLSEELQALSEFARNQGPNLIQPFVQNNLPSNLRPQQDDISSFTVSLVPEVFDLILQRWERARSNPTNNSVGEVIRSGSGYVSDEANRAGVINSTGEETEPQAHPIMVRTVQENQEPQSPLPNSWDDVALDHDNGCTIDGFHWVVYD